VSKDQSFRGVVWDKDEGMWRVRVTLADGRRTHVGFQGAAASLQALQAPGTTGLGAERPQALESLGPAASASEAVNPGANGPFVGHDVTDVPLGAVTPLGAITQRKVSRGEPACYREGSWCWYPNSGTPPLCPNSGSPPSGPAGLDAWRSQL